MLCFRGTLKIACTGWVIIQILHAMAKPRNPACMDVMRIILMMFLNHRSVVAAGFDLSQRLRDFAKLCWSLKGEFTLAKKHLSVQAPEMSSTRLKSVMRLGSKILNYFSMTDSLPSLVQRDLVRLPLLNFLRLQQVQRTSNQAPHHSSLKLGTFFTASEPSYNGGMKLSNQQYCHRRPRTLVSQEFAISHSSSWSVSALRAVWPSLSSRKSSESFSMRLTKRTGFNAAASLNCGL